MARRANVRSVIETGSLISMSGQDEGFEEAPERPLISACKVYMLEHALYKAAAVLCGPIVEKRKHN